MAVKNKYKVCVSRWRRWDERAREVFNNTYKAMAGSQWIFRHPDADIIAMDHWDTVSWNAAWVAADAAMGHKTTLSWELEVVEAA